MTPKILLTGGLGYIGSHTIIELIKNKKNLIIIDNLSNSSKNIKKKLSKIIDISGINFIEGDILDTNMLNKIHDKVDIVIHFAALKSVSESIKEPIKYYKNNIQGLLNIITFCENKKINKLIFSSSATVYGGKPSPLYETDNLDYLGITNPYGRTKLMSELILKDYCHQKANDDFNVICLRYFNPVGNHPSGYLGDDPYNEPTNLMPIVSKVVINNNFSNKLLNEKDDDKYRFLSIYGDNYRTKDGTAERDYIHVLDLAKAHSRCCEKIGKFNENFKVFNIGTGRPTTVLEIIEKFSKINKVKIPYKISGKRDGDLGSVYCNCDKAKKELGWKNEKNLDDICLDIYAFIKKIN